MSARLSLVEFQREIFAQIDAYRLRGDEHLCMRVSSGKTDWAMDASDILHVTQMLKGTFTIPSAANHVRGIIQQDGDVYTVFDLGHILSGLPTPNTKSNRVLILQPALMAGVALLVEKSYSLVSMDQVQTLGLGSHEFSENTVAISGEKQHFQWLHFEHLLTSSYFAARRIDIQAK